MRPFPRKERPARRAAKRIAGVGVAEGDSLFDEPEQSGRLTDMPFLKDSVPSPLVGHQEHDVQRLAHTDVSDLLPVPTLR